MALAPVPFIMKLLKRLAYVGAFGALLTVAACKAYMMYEPDRTRFPVRGIDVSHHQGAIDWHTVAANDVSFAFIKATEGGDHSDKRFKENWEAAREAGIPRGAYHFFTLCRPAVDQAAHFIRSVPKEADSLPPVVDLEFGGNCDAVPKPEALYKHLETFLSTVEAHYGKKPILYVTQEFYDMYLSKTSQFADYPVWARSILREPAYVKGEWQIWQYHNRGQVAGITGPVDLNAAVSVPK